jgi:RNA polymerase sigma-70 factor (ECF subfamily)
MPISDEELAILSRRESKYFDQIVKRYTESIRRYIARLIGNWQESEDVTQDVFVKAFINIASFNPKMKFSSWLYRIAHNESVNYIKRNYRYKEVEFSDEVKNKLLDDKTALEKIIDKERIESVRESLVKLKSKDREILELYYFEQKTYLEISDILKMSVNSIGPTINRARAKLKKILKNE